MPKSKHRKEHYARKPARRLEIKQFDRFKKGGKRFVKGYLVGVGFGIVIAAVIVGALYLIGAARNGGLWW